MASATRRSSVMNAANGTQGAVTEPQTETVATDGDKVNQPPAVLAGVFLTAEQLAAMNVRPRGRGRKPTIDPKLASELEKAIEVKGGVVWPLAAASDSNKNPAQNLRNQVKSWAERHGNAHGNGRAVKYPSVEMPMPGQPDVKAILFTPVWVALAESEKTQPATGTKAE